MAYEPLHHKYRPQNFAQLKGQEAIAQTLTNALNSVKIAPAYLFSGPRGTGKTSSARILAKSLNCLSSEQPTAKPCGECEVCKSINNGSALDVIEIDAASNTGVDNIREIIERSQFAPVKCRYKVYVIDECHMLSTAAFNALLKTLEEPPPRVIFVLATTDPQRVLPTIISRCQRFDYRRIPLQAMVEHLTYIAQQENIEIETEAISLVAQLANGGMRDAESLLDQLSLLSGTITAPQVWDLVGAVSEQDLLDLLNAIATDQPETVITQCRQLLDRGREPLIVLQNLANFYLTLLIAKTSPQRQDLVPVTKSTWEKLCQLTTQWELNTILQGQKKLKDSEVQIRNTTQPRLWLEITLLNLLPSANPLPTISTTTTTTTKPQSSSNAEIKTPPTTTKSSQPLQNNHPPQTSTPKSEEINITPPSQSTPTPPPANQATPQSDTSEDNEIIDFTNLEEIQQSILDNCQTFARAFFVQSCRLISINNNQALIGVKAKPLLNMARTNFKKEFESVLSRITQKSIKVTFKLDNSLKQTKNNSSNLASESKPHNTNDPSPAPESTTINENNNHFAPENKSKPSNNSNNQPSSPTSSTPSSTPFKKDKVSPKSSSPTAQTNSQSQQNIPSTSTPENNSNQQSKIISKKAAENLVKHFNGEIIFTESKPETKVKITKVTNRPKLEDIADDDDIPF